MFPIVSVQLLGPEAENYDYRLSYQAYAAKGDRIIDRIKPKPVQTKIILSGKVCGKTG